MQRSWCAFQCNVLDIIANTYAVEKGMYSGFGKTVAMSGDGNCAAAVVFRWAVR
jgi:hypothetical protein